MFGPDAPNTSNIALITLVCGWVLTGFALFGLLLLVWSRRLLGISLRLDDYLLLAAFVIAVALVAHTCHGPLLMKVMVDKDD